FVPDPTAVAPNYHLSATERNLTCARLNGRIQLRILHLRHAAAATQPSQVSRTLQNTLRSVGNEVGPSRFGNEAYARDMAMIRAYNARLKELRCPSFDIVADLTNTSPDHFPAPVHRK
ncbi:MAG: hypothetical protein ACR2PA_20275, partial [Hyphomicrobiaceae bacterium]